ncbi:hypothetical protein HYT02_00250 [Candidatus Gottesmanbacteria bacterium]|nr:hypothetical protein [Candidatus Gottesmanbacteria bacterium]
MGKEGQITQQEAGSLRWLELVKRTCRDLHEVCILNNVYYAMFGSTAIAASTGEMFGRIRDVDAFIEIEQMEVVGKALVDRGYSADVVGRRQSLDMVILFNATGRTEINLLSCQKNMDNSFDFSIPGMSPLKLKIPEVMAQTREGFIDGQLVFSLKPEALWLFITSSMKLMKLGDVDENRMKKLRKYLEILDRHIDPQLLQEMVSCKPGVYSNKGKLIMLLGEN